MRLLMHNERTLHHEVLPQQYMRWFVVCIASNPRFLCHGGRISMWRVIHYLMFNFLVWVELDEKLLCHCDHCLDTPLAQWGFISCSMAIAEPECSLSLCGFQYQVYVFVLSIEVWSERARSFHIIYVIIYFSLLLAHTTPHCDNDGPLDDKF